MAFDTDGDVHGVTDNTTSFLTANNNTEYSEAEASKTGTIGTIPGDSANEVDPRRLMERPEFDKIRWLYRTSWGKTIVDKPVEDAFKNGFDISTPEDRDFRAILEDANWEQHFKRVRKKARRDGFALSFLVLEDDADGPWENPYDDSVTVDGLHKLETLTLDDLSRYKSSRGVIRAGENLDPLTEKYDYEDYEIRPTGVVVDIDPDSDTYKEPLGYLVGPDDFPANRDEVEFIHTNRIIHYTVNDTVDGDLADDTYGKYEGDSVLTSSYHILNGIKKGNWSLMQVIYRYAAKLYHVELPEDANEDDFKNANQQLQNLNAKSEIITPNGYQMDDFQSDGQLDPREYFDVLFDQVCAANEMTKSVLFGTQTGTVSGSETDIKNYFNKVERLRQREYTEDMRTFVSRYVSLTDSRAAKSYTASFDVEWGPMFKLTELDQAETLSRKMQTLSAAINSYVMTPSEARTILSEEWAEFDIDDDTLSPEEREFIEAIQVAQMGSEKALTNRNEQPGLQQGSTQQQNGGGRQQGETSDPANPTADSPVADPSDPDQWGTATTDLATYGLSLMTDIRDGTYIETDAGRGLVFESRDGPIEYQGETYNPGGEIAVIALEDGGSALYDGDSVLAESDQSVDMDLPDGWDRKSLLDWWESVGTSFEQAQSELQDEQDVSQQEATQIAARYKDMALGTTDWRGEGKSAY